MKYYKMDSIKRELLNASLEELEEILGCLYESKDFNAIINKFIVEREKNNIIEKQRDENIENVRKFLSKGEQFCTIHIL